MSRTRIKICGFTQLDNALEAIELGVDAIGFVFVKASPRFVTIVQAATIIRQLPPFVQTVGLFMNQAATEIAEIVEHVPLNLLQFHGDESPEFCGQFSLPYIKAVPMGGGVNPTEYMAQFPDAVGFLLDSHPKGGLGGSGDKFDWQSIPANTVRPIILAGGLTIDNVKSAVLQVKPYAVDVSSGVERSKGIKDSVKMAAFIANVLEGDS